MSAPIHVNFVFRFRSKSRTNRKIIQTKAQTETATDKK